MEAGQSCPCWDWCLVRGVGEGGTGTGEGHGNVHTLTYPLTKAHGAPTPHQGLLPVTEQNQRSRPGRNLTVAHRAGGTPSQSGVVGRGTAKG